MRKFLIQCFKFGMLVATTLAAGEYLVRTYVDNPYKFKHEWMSRNAGDVEILVLGSSHTYYGINPALFDSKAFNLANVSQIFHYDYVLLTQYAGLYDSLKTVILPVSYFSFFDPEFEDSDTDWIYAVNYKIYMDVNEHSDFSKYNFELSRPAIYSGKLSSLLSGKGLSYDSLGMGTDYLSGSKQIGWEETGKQTAVRHTSAGHDAVEGHFRYARKIADFCRKRHLELVLVTTPAWHSYYENLDLIQAEMTDSLIGVLRDQYGLHYLDYMRDKRFTADDFYDADHLSSDVGARKFTDILIHDLSTLK